jgi:hypothetical protein
LVNTAQESTVQFIQQVDIGFSNIITDTDAVKALHESTDFRQHGGPFWAPRQYLRSDVLSFLSALDIAVKDVHAIRLIKDSPPHPHTDDPGPGDWGRLMWWEGTETDMVWYRLKEEQSMMTRSRPQDQALTYMLYFHQVEEIHRVRLPSTNPVIVRTGTWHSGFNHSEQPCFGWQVWPVRDGRHMTFDELTAALAAYHIS